MQISKLTLIACMAGAVVWQTDAQPASSETQEKALELLRQAISQQGQPAATPAPESAPAQAMIPAPASPSAAAPASSESQEAALSLLRKAISEQQAGTQVVPAKSAPARHSRKSTSPAKTKPATTSAAESVTPATAPSVVPAIPDQPSGPKTKRERLAELLEQYKADKLTPAEYHAQRAKILAEP